MTVCRGIHAQSVSGTALETFSLEPCSLSGICARAGGRAEFYPLSITPVTEKSCLGRQGVNVDVALQLATAVVGTSVSGLVGEEVVGKAGAGELLMHQAGEEQ